MHDTATISRTARIVDALAQADNIAQLISEARAVELHDRPSASQLLDEAIAATRELPDLHELHAVDRGLGAVLGEIPAASAGMTDLILRGCQARRRRASSRTSAMALMTPSAICSGVSQLRS